MPSWPTENLESRYAACGMTHSTMTTAGASGSLEVVRQLCDEGFSRRDRHLRKEYKKIMHPKQATSETLQKAPNNIGRQSMTSLEKQGKSQDIKFRVQRAMRGFSARARGTPGID